MATEENPTSTWLGRYNFSRSVCHRIDSRIIPDLCFPKEKLDRFHPLPPLDSFKKRLESVKSFDSCAKSVKVQDLPRRSFESAANSSKTQDSGRKSLDSSPKSVKVQDSGRRSPDSGKEGKSFHLFASRKQGKAPDLARKPQDSSPERKPLYDFSDSTRTSSAASSNPSSPFASPARVDEFRKNPLPKRVESWSQYLEESGQEVRAVERAEEWVVDMSQLFLGQKFASGAHSRLYHGIYKGKSVAVKVMRQPDEDEEVARMVDRQFTHEVSLLSRLHHRNIVQFVAACKRPPVFCVITEYLEGGSLRGFLHKNEPGTLPLKMTLGMALDIAKGMEYIHSQGVIHGDLKSENLVLDTDMCVKITDFGVARYEADAAKMGELDVGTYRWMAPEMISHKKCSTKVDVYSFAIVLWELLTGLVPFQEMNCVQAAYAVVHKEARPEIFEDCPNVLASLMQRCWSANPEKRPSFVEIVKILEQFEDSSSKASTYNVWHCPSERTKYFLGCFSRCKKCTPVKCNCKS